jgi:hypothetical protein
MPAVKWRRHANSQYEIHAHTLASIELPVLIPHCTETKQRIVTAVTTDAHLGPSLFKAFSRTLSETLVSTWSLIADGLEQTEEDFDNAFLKRFIGTHATEEDRHELVQQLFHPDKPRNVSVHDFYYRLMQLNNYIEWLPGNKAPLSSEFQLRTAYHDGMPVTWKNSLVAAGLNHHMMPPAGVLNYFRGLERNAQQKQLDNTVAQCRASSTD